MLLLNLFQRILRNKERNPVNYSMQGCLFFFLLVIEYVAVVGKLGVK